MDKSKIEAQMLNDSTQPLLHKTDVSGSSIAGFQTPDKVCTYMSSFLPDNAGTILEPTSGLGNLVKELKHKGTVIEPQDFFAMEKQRFDWVVMNPPFTP